ncbi:MAG TPA: hypothetical protein PKM25_09465 [Candidatus Ozemobacteraceae bacterium]|nr:hypothetical protein [Candidatus Ozemobacteraceae bacterium]
MFHSAHADIGSLAMLSAEAADSNGNATTLSMAIFAALRFYEYNEKIIPIKMRWLGAGK